MVGMSLSKWNQIKHELIEMFILSVNFRPIS